ASLPFAHPKPAGPRARVEIMSEPALAQAIQQLIRIIRQTLNNSEVRGSHSVHGQGLRAALMMTLGQHMDAKTLNSESLTRGEQPSWLAQLSVGLWGVKDSLEAVEQTKATEYARQLFRELCECRLYKSVRDPVSGRDEARFRPVDKSLLNDL